MLKPRGAVLPTSLSSRQPGYHLISGGGGGLISGTVIIFGVTSRVVPELTGGLVPSGGGVLN